MCSSFTNAIMKSESVKIKKELQHMHKKENIPLPLWASKDAFLQTKEQDKDRRCVAPQDHPKMQLHKCTSDSTSEVLPILDSGRKTAYNKVTNDMLRDLKRHPCLTMEENRSSFLSDSLDYIFKSSAELDFSAHLHCMLEI